MATHGEFARLDALARHLAADGPGLPVGVGDDAAVLGEGEGRVVACLDVLVEGVHFRRDLSSPDDVGWKAVAVNVSDLAAMGARPEAVLVGLHRSTDLEEADIESLYTGLAAAGRAYGAPIIGGDTVTSPVWALSVTALGRPVGPVVTRAGARPGDRLLLVGGIGAAAAALWGWERDLPVPESVLRAHRRPAALPRSGMALAQAGATAMIDLSDGLGADAGHLAARSDVALEVDLDAVTAAVPDAVRELVPASEVRSLAVGGGEDFALLAAVPADRAEACAAALDAVGEAPWRWLGRVVEGGGEVWLGAAGEGERIDGLGYDHG